MGSSEELSLKDHYIDKLIENNDIPQKLFLESLEAIVFWKEDGKILIANNAALRIFECSLAEIQTKRLEDFIYEKNDKYRECTKKLYDNGAVRDELIFKMSNGQIKALDFTIKLHVYEDCHIGIFRNISEWHRQTNALSESEYKFRKVFEGASIGLMLWNDEYKIYDINYEGELYLEMEKEQLTGMQIRDIFVNCDLTDEEILQKLNRKNGQFSLTLNSGIKKTFEYSTKFQVFSGLHLTTFKDITEKLDMEAQIHKSETMHVLGELAAGIAHEIRNPMTALKGFIQLLEGSVEKNGRNEMYFNIIKTELTRIDSIVNEFLFLSKPQSVKYSKKELSEIMRETLDLLCAQAVLYNVQFEASYERNLPKIMCEPNQIKKVFINIIKNAIEVMPKGGVINVHIRKGQKGFVHITIEDQGSGISADKVQQLGKPFYTTKERGTGLGLMVTFKIIEEHKGTINIESEIGKGTTFHISLPLNFMA